MTKPRWKGRFTTSRPLGSVPDAEVLSEAASKAAVARPGTHSRAGRATPTNSGLPASGTHPDAGGGPVILD